MKGPIDMEWNGLSGIRCWTHYATMNFDLDHNLNELNEFLDFKVYF